MTTIESTSNRLIFTSNATEASVDVRRRRIPLTMPKAQEYYWHFGWQHGEREALADIERGEFVRFDSDDPNDIARWLDDPAAE